MSADTTNRLRRGGWLIILALMILAAWMLFRPGSRNSEARVLETEVAAARAHHERGPEPPGEKSYPVGGSSVHKAGVGLERSSALDSNGEFSIWASQELGLTEKQYEGVKAILHTVWAEQSDEFAKRAVRDPDASHPERGVECYDFYALPDRGLAHWKELEARLTPVIGERKANRLINSFGDAFAGYGRYDARLKVTTVDGNPRIQIEMTNPITGKSASSWETDAESFHRMAGTSYTIENGKLRFNSGGK